MTRRTHGSPRSENPHRFGTLPAGAEDPWFYLPIVRAEEARGNTGELYFGDAWDDRTAFLFEYPISLDAILEQFELDEGMAVTEDPQPGILYFRTSSTDGIPVWSIGGARHDAGPAQLEARDRWWRDWRAAPQTRELLANPFLTGGVIRTRTPPEFFLASDDGDVGLHTVTRLVDDDPALVVLHIERADGGTSVGVARDRWGAVWRDPVPGDPRYVKFWPGSANDIARVRERALRGDPPFERLVVCATADDAARYGFSTR